MSDFLNRSTDMRVRSHKTKLFRLAIWQRQDSKRNLLLMGSSRESTMNPISSEPSLKWQPAVDLRLQVFPLHRLHQPWGQYFRSGRFIFTSFVKTTAIIFMDVFSTWKPWNEMNQIFFDGSRRNEVHRYITRSRLLCLVWAVREAFIWQTSWPGATHIAHTHNHQNFKQTITRIVNAAQCRNLVDGVTSSISMPFSKL